VGVARGAGAKGAGCQSGPPRTGGVVGGVLTRSWNPVRVATDFAGDGAWFSFSSGAAGLGSGLDGHWKAEASATLLLQQFVMIFQHFGAGPAACSPVQPFGSVPTNSQYAEPISVPNCLFGWWSSTSMLEQVDTVSLL